MAKGFLGSVGGVCCPRLEGPALGFAGLTSPQDSCKVLVCFNFISCRGVTQ